MVKISNETAHFATTKRLVASLVNEGIASYQVTDDNVLILSHNDDVMFKCRLVRRPVERNGLTYCKRWFVNKVLVLK